MSRTLLGALVAAPAFLFSLCAGSTSAAVIGSPSALHPASTLIDFNALPVGTVEPVISSGATITTFAFDHGPNPPQTVKAPKPHQVQYPGIFTGNYFAPGAHHFRIEFDSPVSQVGLGVHDPNFAGNELFALDSAGNLLEKISSIPTGPVGGVFSTFVGFVRPSADIASVELHNAQGDLLGIDNVMFFSSGGTGAIPEPTSLALAGVLGGGLALFAWRKRAK
jgi:hypothetical protein